LKGPAHYITHVPFIWAEPQARTPRRTDVLAGTLDIAATILDRVKVEPYNGVKGLSLLPVLEGAAAVARDSMVVEDDQERAVFGLLSGARLRTLVTPRWRMTIAHGDLYCELYDFKNDPHEMDNLFGDAAHRCVRGELTEKLAYRKWNFPTPVPCRSGEPNPSRAS
jgi:arylsulfatase A-like enzyme